MIGLVTEEEGEGEKAIVRSAPDGSDKHTLEKSPTNATSVTMHHLRQAI